MAFGSPGVYPLPAVGGPQYAKFRALQPDYAAVTDRHEYDDGGISIVLANDVAPVIFVIEYTGLSIASAALLYTHRADAFGEAFGFQLTLPRSPSTVYQGVRYLEWTEDHTRTWNNKITVKLIWRPAP